MNNFIFENSTKVYFGKGCVNEYLGCLLKNTGNNVLLVYGSGSIKRNGIYDEVISLLKKLGKNIFEFSDVMSNPTYKKVQEGIQIVKENKIDFILGVGGGSVMDLTKAVSLGSSCNGDLWENYYEQKGIIDFELVPFGFIVTVTGTGSECNGGSVITNEQKHIKTGRDYPECNAKFALLDPSYTMSVPLKQTVSGGFDILSHIMETYFSGPDTLNVSDLISESLMKSVIYSLREIVKDPYNYEARSNLMWASTMAENRLIKLGKKCDFECHQIEHQLGAYTNCNHGQGLAILHPTYYRHIYLAGLKKFVRFATEIFHVSENQSEENIALEGIQCLEDFIQEIGLPTRLSEIGITDKEILREVAKTSNRSQGAYRILDDEEIYEILLEVL